MKLAIVGGHLTPALSLMEYAMRQGDECLFIGRHYSSHDHNIESREKAEVENRGGIFVNLDSAKINRHRVVASLVTLPMLIRAIARAKVILDEHKPDLIVSFGGYLAVPVVIAGRLRGIPIFTHEQTRVFGLANQIIALFADKIGLSWENTQGVVMPQKAVVTGNPLRSELRSNAPKPDWAVGTLPMIYITGGSQGSHVINKLIGSMLKTLTQRYYVIHQCGTNTDFDYLSRERITLDKSGQENCTIRTWFSASEVSWISQHARFIISRSGANTVSEMIQRELPGILIPLPNAGKNEQYQNAIALGEYKASLILTQDQLSVQTLMEHIEVLDLNLKEYQKNMRKLKQWQIKNPETLIYGELKALYETKHH